MPFFMERSPRPRGAEEVEGATFRTAPPKEEAVWGTYADTADARRRAVAATAWKGVERGILSRDVCDGD